MQIIKQIWEKFQRVAELTLKVLEEGTNFLSFEEKLWQELNNLGQEVLREVLEAKDAYLREHREKRPGWRVERRNDPKEVLTLFGLVNYKRTYYRHKETGERVHLIDRLVGYGPHARVDPLVKAQALEEAVDLSYRKSGERVGRGNREVVLSGEAVKKVIHNFTLEELPEPPGEKRRGKVLYVEADEDHVAGQDGKKYLPRLVYIHEGKEKVGKDRYRLKRPYYLGGLYSDTDELWFEVLSYIEEQYELSSVERIYLCGDGDRWIKKGLEFLPRSVFVLDLFHLDKYLVAALGRDSDGYREIWAALWEGDEVKVQAILRRAGKAAASPARKEAVRDCRRYIRRNWEGIMAYRLYPGAELGVSAEAHVSHLFSARLSSRPMAWSARGVDRMARLRVAKANGVSLREQYVARRKEGLKALEIDKAAVEEERQRLRKISGEVFDNLPALRGPVTSLTRALKALSRNIDLLW
ncbi:ISLre2 family transposase [Desulfothermobacter acidiphilus]|uniref:ISLre2 family transposase n=1 Tax=Desulfothermobacter acidiphilus TaxID=1938353 RepID=UPI003F88B521